MRNRSDPYQQKSKKIKILDNIISTIVYN